MKNALMMAALLVSGAVWAQGKGEEKRAEKAAEKAEKKDEKAEKKDEKAEKKEGEAAAMPPPPAKELSDAMAASEGTWKCSGKTLDGFMGPGHPMDGKSTTKKDLNGYWFVTKWEEKKSKQSPMPYSMWSTVGWDAEKKVLTRADFDNMGGVTHATSKGWEGEKMVWEGKMYGGPPMGFRETMTKKGKEVASLIEFSKDDKWFPAVEFSCKK